MSQEKKRTVLLIEADISLRRLIVLGLQDRGMQVIEASSLAAAPDLEDETEKQLDLLILDIDRGIHCDWSSLDAIQSHPRLVQLPTVVLTWEQPPENITHTVSVATIAPTQVVYLTKPFDARTLLTTAEQLLSIRIAKEVALEAKAEEALLAAYAVNTAPSLWPVITAVGLLLAVIGFMFQAAITVLGFLIVIVALLLWALGTKPVAEEIALS